jgi:hypothetical protein
MVDKITTVSKLKVGARVGRLDNKNVLRLNQAALVFLGLAVGPAREALTKLAGGTGSAMRQRNFVVPRSRATIPPKATKKKDTP